jgi:hypothetical protein
LPSNAAESWCPSWIEGLPGVYFPNYDVGGVVATVEGVLEGGW